MSRIPHPHPGEPRTAPDFTIRHVLALKVVIVVSAACCAGTTRSSTENIPGGAEQG
ncbi:hypothetical protein GCM10009818_27220 [Nakamurella flavida]